MKIAIQILSAYDFDSSPLHTVMSVISLLIQTLGNVLLVLLYVATVRYIGG